MAPTGLRRNHPQLSRLTPPNHRQEQWHPLPPTSSASQAASRLTMTPSSAAPRHRVRGGIDIRRQGRVARTCFTAPAVVGIYRCVRHWTRAPVRRQETFHFHHWPPSRSGRRPGRSSRRQAARRAEASISPRTASSPQRPSRSSPPLDAALSADPARRCRVPASIADGSSSSTTMPTRPRASGEIPLTTAVVPSAIPRSSPSKVDQAALASATAALGFRSRP